MKKIKEAILNFINEHKPIKIVLMECHVRRIHALFTSFHKELTLIQAGETARVIDRLTAQLPSPTECSCKPCTFLIYETDKKVLKDFLNTYCLWIAEKYDSMPWFAQLIATIKYEDFTNIMRLIK